MDIILFDVSVFVVKGVYYNKVYFYNPGNKYGFYP